MTEAPARGQPAERYAVVGHPVTHSKSPLIHGLFARQTDQNLSYSAIDIPPGEFISRVEEFFRMGGAGLNVTVPYKEEAWQLAEVLSPSASLAGAVNTLYLDNRSRLCGENTDGLGIVRDLLVNQGGAIRGREILILGAGGAVRGVLEPLLREQPASITIANRTVSRAEALIGHFRSEATARNVHMAASGYEELQGRNRAFDLIINGTSAGLKGDMPPLPAALVGSHTWCYDMVYGPGVTTFQQWALAQSADRALDGLGMLVEQAAEAFRLWRGVRPETASVLETLRASLR